MQRDMEVHCHDLMLNLLYCSWDLLDLSTGAQVYFGSVVCFHASDAGFYG